MLAVMKPWCEKDRAVVVYAKAGADTLPFLELQEELTDLLARTLK